MCTQVNAYKQQRHVLLGRGDDTVGSPRRAHISQFELFELILLFKFDKQLLVERHLHTSHAMPFHARVQHSITHNETFSILWSL